MHLNHGKIHCSAQSALLTPSKISLWCYDLHSYKQGDGGLSGKQMMQVKRKKSTFLPPIPHLLVSSTAIPKGESEQWNATEIFCCFTCLPRTTLQKQNYLPWCDKIHKYNYHTLLVLPGLLQRCLVYEIPDSHDWGKKYIYFFFKGQRTELSPILFLLTLMRKILNILHPA